MALTSHGIETMTLPGDQSLRDEPSRCLPSSSAYSSFFFTEPSVSASERHLYSPFFQAPPPLQHDPSPTPHLGPTYCYSDGDRSPMTTISSNETYGKALRTSHDSRYYAHRASPSLFTPYTEDFPRTDESLQPVDEAHHSAKYKNLHSGRDLKKIDPCGPFKCKWTNCLYPGLFARKAVLMRHIETQHVSPRSFECPDKKCERSFNRKDNMEEHWRRVH